MHKNLILLAMLAGSLTILGGCSGERYEYKAVGGTLYKIDHKTGDIWRVRGSRMEEIHEANVEEEAAPAYEEAAPAVEEAAPPGWDE